MFHVEQTSVVNCPVCQNSKFSPYLRVTDHFLSKQTFLLQRCDSCSFVMTSPRPNDSFLPQFYDSDEYLSHGSRKSVLSLAYSFAKKLNLKAKGKIISTIGVHSILDYGAGEGSFVHHFRKQGYVVEGFEPNAKARENAQKKNVVLHEALPDKRFDLITMWHVLEHIPNLTESLRAIKAQLKPDGHLIIAVPNIESFDAQEYGSFWAAYDVPRHLWHFSANTLTQLMSQFGFTIINTFPMPLDAYYISLMSAKYMGRSKLHAILTAIRSNQHARLSKLGTSSTAYLFRNISH